ncbi:MAG: hypothetical protein AAGG07_01575 [Planctomycetota bacterium]
MRVRRWAIGAAWTALLLAGTGTAAVALHRLAEHTGWRADVTSASRHRLSDRAAQAVAGLNGNWEIVVAFDASQIPPVAATDLRDTLTAFDLAGPGLSATLLDTASAEGRQRYAELLERLTERDANAISASVARLSAVAGALADTAATLAERTAPGLAQVRDEIDPAAPAGEANRQFFDQRAAAARLLARELSAIAQELRASLDTAEGLPPIDVLAGQLRTPIAAAREQLGSLAEQLDRFVGAVSLDANAQDAASPLLTEARMLRDALGRAGSDAELGTVPPALIIQRALEADRGALVVGPGTARAIDLDELVLDPAAAAAVGLGRGDLRRRGEELLATALISASGPPGPIVLLTHAEAQPFLDRSSLFSTAITRLRSRGIDVLEWATVTQSDPPSTAVLDPDGLRSIVIVGLSPDSAAGRTAQGEGLTGPQRAQRFAAAVGSQLDRGRPVLLSLNPSVLPSFGEPDPIAALAEPYGVSAGSSTPVLRAEDGEYTPSTTSTAVAQRSSDAPGSSPIARAIAGLRMRLEWAIPLKVTDTRAAALLAVGTDSASEWAEADWVGFWRTPREARPTMPTLPEPDADRDDIAGPWDVIVASERSTSDSLGAASRMVIVGSNSWFADPVAAEAALVDGRAIALNPANLELLEASVWWLAGRDELIAQSATVGTVPTVRPIEPDRLRMLRLAVAIAPPALLLALGLALRLLRR